MVHNIQGKQRRLLQLIHPALYATPEGKINNKITPNISEKKELKC